MIKKEGTLIENLIKIYCDRQRGQRLHQDKNIEKNQGQLMLLANIRESPPHDSQQN